MIKKYNQFVENKTNEEFVSGEPQTRPTPSRPNREVEIAPGRPEPSTRPMPTRPSVVPGKRPSEEDAPLANYEEEEEDDIFYSKIKELAMALKIDLSDIDNNSINYNGKTIIYPSETSKFHVDRKKFSTVAEVVAYLTGNMDKPKIEERVDPEFEAKSYKYTRKDRLK